MVNERNKLGPSFKKCFVCFYFLSNFLREWRDEKADDQMSGMFWDLCVPSARYGNILQGCEVIISVLCSWRMTRQSAAPASCHAQFRRPLITGLANLPPVSSTSAKILLVAIFLPLRLKGYTPGYTNWLSQSGWESPASRTNYMPFFQTLEANMSRKYCSHRRKSLLLKQSSFKRLEAFRVF